MRWRKLVDKFFLTALILAIPLYQKFPLFAVPGTSTRIRLEDFLLFGLLLYVMYLLIPRLKRFLSGGLERSITIFLSVGFLSLLSAFLVTRTVGASIGFLHWARRVEYFVPLFFALTLPKDNRREYLSYVIKLLFVVITIAFVYGFGQKNLNWPIIVTQNQEYSKGVALRYVAGAHVTSTFAGHYDLASFLVLVLPLVVTSFFVIKDKYYKLGSGVVFVFGLWLLANSLSRISVVAYLIAIFIALVLMRKFKALVLVLVVSLVVFSFSSALLDRYLTIIQVTKDSINHIMTTVVPDAHAAGPTLPGTTRVLAALEDRSTSIRLNVEWPRALRALTKNPLLGTGYSSITLATDNDYLRLLGEVGILGFGSFMLIIANVFLNFLKVLKSKVEPDGFEKVFVYGLFGGFCGSLVNATFIDIFEASKFAIIFWMMIGLLVYIVRSHEKTKGVI